MKEKPIRFSRTHVYVGRGQVYCVSMRDLGPMKVFGDTAARCGLCGKALRLFRFPPTTRNPKEADRRQAERLKHLLPPDKRHNTFENKHKLRLAFQVLKMSDRVAAQTGMTKAEARKIILQLTGR